MTVLCRFVHAKWSSSAMLPKGKACGHARLCDLTRAATQRGQRRVVPHVRLPLFLTLKRRARSRTRKQARPALMQRQG